MEFYTELDIAVGNNLLMIQQQLIDLFTQEKESEKKVVIYPLTKDNKLIKGIDPFIIPSDCSVSEVKKLLGKAGLKPPFNWYGCKEDKELPSEYLN